MYYKRGAHTVITLWFCLVYILDTYKSVIPIMCLWSFLPECSEPEDDEPLDAFFVLTFQWTIQTSTGQDASLSKAQRIIWESADWPSKFEFDFNSGQVGLLDGGWLININYLIFIVLFWDNFICLTNDILQPHVFWNSLIPYFNCSKVKLLQFL